MAKMFILFTIVLRFVLAVARYIFEYLHLLYFIFNFYF